MPAPRQFWLHSSDPTSRWNFAGEQCDLVLTFDDRRRVGEAVAADGTILHASNDPFELLDWMSTHPRTGYRWIGYLSYGLGRYIEQLPNQAVDDLGLPLFAFARVTAYATEQSSATASNANSSNSPLLTRTISSDDYQQSIRRVLDYISAGDVFQVNLAQRLNVQTDYSPMAIWHRLLDRHPSRFGALLDFNDFAIISNSPELFFRIEPTRGSERRIINRPIKGTRPRWPGMREALESSAKDIAELAMIVDLQRNDLGRVCEIGSVRVTNAREIETHPTVFHGVATIEGTLRSDVRFSDVLRATFPCGSITGCPKIRAMQIIDELEPFDRGPYCGAIGYLDADGTIEFNVAIRTMTLKAGIASISVGGGIVAESTPLGEYEETLVKAAAMLDALGVDMSHVK